MDSKRNAADQRLKMGLDKKNQLPKVKVMLMSSLIDATARLKAEAEQRRLKRKRVVAVDLTKSLGNVQLHDEADQFRRIAATKGKSIKPLAQRQTSKESSSLKSKWGKLTGQPLEKGTKETREEDPTLVASVKNPLNQVLWESGVNWGDSDAAPEKETGASATTIATASAPVIASASSAAPAEDDIVWDEDDMGEGTIGSGGGASVSAAKFFAEVPEPKRLKMSDIKWDVFSNEGETDKQPSTEVLQMTVAKETNRTMLGRNDKLSSSGWQKQVVWDESQLSEEDMQALLQEKISYHKKDEAFALDEINRKKLLEQRLEQQRKLLLQQQQQKEIAEASTTATSTSTTTAGASDAKAGADKKPGGATSNTGATHPALRGVIAPAPPQPKNIPGRGPPKKELLQRRYTQFGPLLRMMGILETPEGGPIPSLPPPTAVANAQASAAAQEGDGRGSMEPRALGWQSVVPPIHHSQPATELEWFDPEFRFVDPLKSFRRPVAFHREKQVIRLVMDPTQFAQSQLGAGGAGGGVRVDATAGAGTSGVGDPKLSELELAVTTRTWKREDLSSKVGKVFLFEYAEQHPLFVNGIGMQSHLINFYRQERVIPPKPEFGLFVGLNPDEISPLLTRIDPGKVYRVLQNNMMNVPVVEHRPNSTDFLLIRQPKRASATAAGSTTSTSTTIGGSSAASASQQREVAMVRRISRMFVCGQVEPQMEIFQPSEPSASRTRFLNWLEKYMEFQFANRLRRRDDVRMQFQTARDLFASFASDKMVERALSEVAEKDHSASHQVADSKKRYWVALGASEGKSKGDLRRALDEKRRLLLTSLKPEDCCSWEQVQLGLAKLQQAGIERVARSEVQRVLEAYKIIRRLNLYREWSHDALDVNKLRSAFPKEQVARCNAAVRYVLRELELTPWYLSTCFVWLHLHAESINNPFPPNVVMQVTGVGDPSGRSEMVSFLPNYKELADAARSTAAKLTDAAAQAQMAAAAAAMGGSSSAAAAAIIPAEDEDELFFDAVDSKKKSRKRNQAAIDDKPKYGGTENDLRIVKMEDLGQILVALGVPEEEVAKIGRWDRTWLIEKAASSSIGAHLLDGSIAKYARVPGNNNPSLDMAIAGTGAGGVGGGSGGGGIGGGGGDANKADTRGIGMEDFAARKKLEETPSFIAHRERVTKVYERMMATLSETHQQQLQRSTSSVPATVATTTTSASAVTASSSSSSGVATGTAAGGDEEDDDEDLLDFAEGLKETLLTKQQHEEEARRNAALVKHVKDAALQDALAEKNEFEKFKQQVASSSALQHDSTAQQPPASTTTNAITAPAGGVTAAAKFKVLKRTIIEKFPDGTERIRVEYHKNPDTVKEWEHQQQEKKLQRGSHALTKFQYGETEDYYDDYESNRIGMMVKRKPGGGSGKASSSKGAGGMKRTKSPVPGGGGAFGPGADRDRRKLEEKERQRQETQRQHAEWYKQQVATYGPEFGRSLGDNDPRLPSTMPRRGVGARCVRCHLPGHQQQNPLCPVYDPVEIAKIQAQEAAVAAAAAQASGGGDGSGSKKKDKGGKKREGGGFDVGLHSLPPGPLAELSKRFLRILDLFDQHPSSGPFLKPVDKKLVPNYYKVISRPIDLSKIRNKASLGQYKDRDQFWADLQLMLQNSHQFNGPNSEISYMAQQLVDVAKKELDADMAEMERLETLIAVSKTPSKRGLAAKKSVAVQAAAQAAMTSALLSKATSMVIPEEGDEEEIIIEDDAESTNKGRMVMPEEGEEEEIIVEEEDGEDFSQGTSGEIML